MPIRNIYLKIESIHHYSPVEPEDHTGAPRQYGRDCMYTPGHEDGLIPRAEIEARSLEPLIYREYLDPGFAIPKPDRLIAADINEPVFEHRVPGALIYCHAGDQLRIHVLNWDSRPHSLHMRGVSFGIDSDGVWPFGTSTSDGRRSDEICPGESWTYVCDVTYDMVGAWPFHDHYRRMQESVNRGLFGGLIVLPEGEPIPPCIKLPGELPGLLERLAVRPLPISGLGPGRVAHGSEEASHRHADSVAPLARHAGSHDDKPSRKRDKKRDEPAPEVLAARLAGDLEFLKEYAQLDYVHLRPPKNETLHVPLFIHRLDGERQSTICINGRAFTGNTPTVVTAPGQRIRWYVFNLDLETSHTFHADAQYWMYGGQPADLRGIAPGESFVVETVAPRVITLPPDIAATQARGARLKDAEPYDVRGDFLFHGGDVLNGVAGILRSREQIWLTPAQATAVRAGCGLPLDPWTNTCPPIDPDRCETVACGQWTEVPGDPMVTMMHAALLPGTEKILYWGYNRNDLSRTWDAATGTYAAPANQPIDVSANPGDPNSWNLWSAEHAFLNTPEGKLLVHGGFTPNQSYIFDPATLSWSLTGPTADVRFYSTTLTLADGRVLTLFGSGMHSIEVYDPVAGTWAAPIPVPLAFDYLYYPWIYLLPGGDLFIAGPTGVSRRFDWSAPADDPARTWPTIAGNRSTGGEKGTSVLLPLRPPFYEPRVLIAGGNTPAAEQTAEIIDLSVPSPAWTALPNMNVARPEQFTAVIMPDSQILISGGTFAAADGGPSELLDTRDLASGWRQCSSMAHKRGYHSSNILLADGSVLMGGDPVGANGPTPHERYFPWYFSKVRPVIDSAPLAVSWGETFTIDTADAGAITEVVLIRPGAVTHGFNMSQRYVELAITATGANSIDVVSPPDGFIAPPGPYLLFIVNGSRVPSIGRWLRISP